jgi:hypothetical protein
MAHMPQINGRLESQRPDYVLVLCHNRNLDPLWPGEGPSAQHRPHQAVLKKSGLKP